LFQDKEPIITIAEVIEMHNERRRTTNILKIPSISFIYNLMTSQENLEIKTSIHTNSPQTFDKNAILAKSNIDVVYEKEVSIIENDVSISNLKKKRKFAEFLQNSSESQSERDFCYEGNINFQYN
jgi:hypothetical protein